MGLRSADENDAWYSEVTGYQWLILVIASAGWIFDIYENQIFNVTRGPMLQELLHQPANSAAVKYYGDVLLGAFLVGGAIGGVLFGILADRFGRGVSMIASILVYAVFSAMTAGAHAIWQVAVLRFLVAMGTGGEWAVAAALVAEVFPTRARAYASGLFHASSVLAVAAAAGAGAVAGNNWRLAYLLGLAPALLVIAVRVYVREPVQSRPIAGGERRFPLAALLTDPVYGRRALLGLMLAAVGLGTYWAVFVAGQDLAQAMLLRTGSTAAEAASRSKVAYGVIQNIGSGLGVLSMGPLCAWLGRRRAFTVMQLGALIITPITCLVPSTYGQLLILLPLFGFFINGIHAGYAVYFPELFPAPLRATGAGFCFNGARLLAAPLLWISGWVKGTPGVDLRYPIAGLGILFLAGIVIIRFLPETKGKVLDD